ncbi:YtxH domain-containing protein [Bacillus sp. AGMB 02131]|uniref:YtxH domain-containing protein n=1 Tax=Peribacillus faecalis TaxID=2772559 RepID=A0A927HDA8_9BACI|nr:YtxH domain-containing protein [Peribacillus faecalis]MBD3110497.1 YtxH domain-containing protein [Peribacillus faecalis]
MTANEKQEFVREEKNDINTKDFMIGALIGGMLGAAAALLLAPKSGKELRNDINDGAKYISDKTEKLRQTAIEKSTEIAEAAKSKTNTLSEKVSQQSATILENVKNVKQKVTKAAPEATGTEAESDSVAEPAVSEPVAEETEKVTV